MKRLIDTYVVPWWMAQKSLWKARQRNKKLLRQIKIANELTRVDRKSRYVIDLGDKFKILSTDDVDRMKKYKEFPKGTTIMDVYRNTVYTATYSPDVKDAWKIMRYREKNKAEGLKQ
jgi:hypothetical protein